MCNSVFLLTLLNNVIRGGVYDNDYCRPL